MMVKNYYGKNLRGGVSPHKDGYKGISLRGQMILALVPSFVSQIIAFYRIQKLVYGIVIEVIVFFIDMVIQVVFSWPFGMIIAMPVTVGLPLYYVRKWTLEYNRENRGLFG